MLVEFNFSRKLDKFGSKEKVYALGERLVKAQRLCREAKIPVIILFEGWSASGKGSQISELMQWLDPRGFEVFNLQSGESEDKMYPHLKKYWNCLPAKGRMSIFDRSWYRALIYEYEDGKTVSAHKIGDILSFEKTLTDSGVLIIKLFLHISEKEQKKRLETLNKDAGTAWRVKKTDLKQNKKYDKLLKDFDEMLLKTDHAGAKWTVVEAMDRRFSKVEVLKTVVEAMENALVAKNEVNEPPESLSANRSKGSEDPARSERDDLDADKCTDGAGDGSCGACKGGATSDSPEDAVKSSQILQSVDLTLSLAPEESRQRRKDAQKDLAKLHNKMYLKRVPAIAVFEGWDAAGKGGAIKRLVKPLDPRGYKVAPYGAPNEVESAHHYLWRFWNEVPKAGHMTVFDRSWYGRVLVERVEGFCSENDWRRAYDEINDFEAQLVRSGVVLVKFWIHIDRQEQLSRFQSRQENPEKQWKITDEDWRNREKWGLYLDAVNDMLLRTSTKHAPWTVVEGNSKPFARVKVLETVRDELKKRL